MFLLLTRAISQLSKPGFAITQLRSLVPGSYTINFTQNHCSSPSQRNLCTNTRKSFNIQKKLLFDEFLNFKAAIFDKDGTLFCFHSMWSPWAVRLVKGICDSSGLSIASQLYSVLGVCPETMKVNTGLLAEGTKAMIRNSLIETLVANGLKENEAAVVVDQHLVSANTSTEYLVELHDLHQLFTILRQHGVKTAICTSDNREATVRSLDSIGILHLVDKIVCGNDPGTQAKPDPANALAICESFNVLPKETIMVGDTVTDMEFGRNAILGETVGVLSGIGKRNELESNGATTIIDSVEDILPILLPNRAINLTAHAQRIRNHPWKLIVLDKDGTLSDIHYKWQEWAMSVGHRLAEASSSEVEYQFYSSLGLCGESGRIRSGLLSGGTTPMLKECLADVILRSGYNTGEVEKIMEKVWLEPAIFGDRIHDGVRDTIKLLRKRGFKIAVNTLDSRQSTLSLLKSSKCAHLIDMVMTADDTKNWKPLPNTILDICAEMKVSPDETMNVGDAKTDMQCGRAAKVGANVAVLSGITTPEFVLPYADVLIPNITYLPELARFTDGPVSTSESSTTTFFKGNKPSSGQKTNSPIMSFKAPSFRQPCASYSTTTSLPTYDYIIVGAGSAGCVLANRFSAENHKVLLLEAGPKDYSWKIHMPAALMYNLCDDKYNWFYHTIPQKHADNRIMYWPRGRVWGGSSSLNAMVYIRGHAFDYNRWEKEGATGWSYADCLPYFKKAQNHELGPDDYRGGSGYLNVTRGKTNHPLHEAFIKAGQEAGYPFTEDMNGYCQEGVGEMDMTIYKGRRWSTAQAYLRPALKRSNLKALTNCFITRVLLDHGRAVGIEYIEGNETKKVFADREVILSAGSINSPQLLMLSGIGNADHLKSIDVQPVHHLPGVGQNLQDHLELYVQQECIQPITLYKAQWKFPHHMIAIGLEWFLKQTGWGATAHLESGGFIRTEGGIEHPDIQIHFLPSTVNDHGRQTGPCHAYQMHIGPMRSKSIGELTLKSNDPREHPILDPKYLAHERDRWEFRTAIRLAREIFAQPAFDKFRGKEMSPGADAVTNEQLDAFVRAMADSAYHPSCTCKMGADSDSMAVLDPQLRVRGIDALRVVDASAMPSIVSGNLNGPTIMLAEKAADIILGKPPLPRSNAPVWTPKYPDRQRDGTPVVSAFDPKL